MWNTSVITSTFPYTSKPQGNKFSAGEVLIQTHNSYFQCLIQTSSQLLKKCNGLILEVQDFPTHPILSFYLREISVSGHFSPTSSSDLHDCVTLQLTNKFVKVRNDNTNLNSIFLRVICIYDYNNSICFFHVAFFV